MPRQMQTRSNVEFLFAAKTRWITFSGVCLIHCVPVVPLLSEDKSQVRDPLKTLPNLKKLTKVREKNNLKKKIKAYVSQHFFQAVDEGN